MRQTWIAAFAALASMHASPQAQTSQAQPSHSQVQLEAQDNRTQFSLGDIIALELVFRDPAFPDVRSSAPPNQPWRPAAGQSVVNATDYNDLADDVTITPSTGWVQWQGHSGHDYSTQSPIDATGVRLPLILNQGFVFREPGHYQVTVTTRRLGGQPLTTNTVDIDIAARSAEDEAALVKSLEARIAASPCDQSGCPKLACAVQQNAARQLAYLTGDDAARAKVKLLLQSNREVSSEIETGLAATRNQALQLELLKAAWADPQIAPDGSLQFALKRTEAFALGQMEPGWVMFGSAPEQNPTTRALAAEYHDDLDRAIATLPQRTGIARRDAAYFLIEDNELSAAQLARVKPFVLEEFPRMDPIAKSMLIETRWNAVKDSSLAPYLKAMIDSKANDIDAATAVQRLIEIDEREARPFVVDMVCRTQRGMMLDKLKGVKEDRLPEVDKCLAAILTRQGPREHDFDWEQAAQRAARFATPAILPQVKAAWTNQSQDASMLALLMRDAPEEAVALLNREPETQWYPTDKVYEARGGSFPPEVLAWLRGPSAPKYAEYQLAQFGESTDRALLQHRLDTLRTQWAARAPEMKDAQPNTPAYLAKSEEQELVSSLLSARAWTLTEDEKLRLTEACLSDWCQRYAPQPKSVPEALASTN